MAEKLKPLFDTLDAILENNHPEHLSKAELSDYFKAREFLLCYQDNLPTFNAYRREVERLLQWCQHKAQKSLTQLRRNDMDAYIKFCQKPPRSWIRVSKVPRFIDKDGCRVPKPKWRPFVVTLPKVQKYQGDELNIKNYILSEKSLREIFTIISSFYNFMLQDNYVDINPVLQVRQKSKYFTKQQTKKVVRKLSELQWGYVIETVYMMADEATLIRTQRVY